MCVSMLPWYWACRDSVLALALSRVVIVLCKKKMFLRSFVPGLKFCKLLLQGLTLPGSRHCSASLAVASIILPQLISQTEVMTIAQCPQGLIACRVQTVKTTQLFRVCKTCTSQGSTTSRARSYCSS
jgi:hypothetical protein